MYIETPQSQAVSINHWKNHNPKTYGVRPQVFIMPQLFKCLYIILLHLMCSNTATFSVFANLLCFMLSNAAALYVLTMLVHSWVVSWFASPYNRSFSYAVLLVLIMLLCFKCFNAASLHVFLFIFNLSYFNVGLLQVFIMIFHFKCKNAAVFHVCSVGALHTYL